MIRFAATKAALEREFAFLSPALPVPVLVDKASPAPKGKPAWLSVDVEKGRVTFQARDSQRTLTTSVDTEGPVQPGQFDLHPGVISQLVRLLPSEVITVEHQDDGKTKLTWSSGHCVLPKVFVSAPAPQTLDDPRRIMLPVDVLRDVLRRAAFAYPEVYDNRFSGVLFNATGEKLQVVACEGAILALIERPSKAAALTFTLTTTTCEALPSLFKDNPAKDVLIEISSCVKATCGVRSLVTPQAVMKFPPWERAMALKHTTRADFPGKLALQALDRAVDNVVNLSLRRGELTFKDDENEATDAIGLDYDGDELSFLFKKKFFKGALRAIDAERIELLGSTDTQPILLRPLNGGGSEQVILMPMRGNA